MRSLSFVEALFKAAESGFEKGGDFLREVAALILVFLPIDLWKNEITWERGVGVVAGSFALFIAGMLCHWTSLGVKRGRLNWEELQDIKLALQEKNNGTV